MGRYAIAKSNLKFAKEFAKNEQIEAIFRNAPKGTGCTMEADMTIGEFRKFFLKVKLNRNSPILSSVEIKKGAISRLDKRKTTDGRDISFFRISDDTRKAVF